MGKRDSTVSVRRMLKGSRVGCGARGGVVDVGDRVIGDALQNARQSYDTHTVGLCLLTVFCKVCVSPILSRTRG